MSLFFTLFICFGFTQIKKVEAVGISWNTFLGFTGSDNGYGIATDSVGNVYVSGWSNGTWGNPLHPYTAISDIFVAKFNSSGTLIWNTFYGGTGIDSSYDLKIDKDENIYITGVSNAGWGAPIRPYTSGTDTFVAKLNKDGALLWHTFLGGTGTDTNIGFNLDSNGNIYVAGHSNASWGTPVRAYASGIDGVVAKVNSSGQLLWSTFLGGDQTDKVLSVVVDNDGHAYAIGYGTGSWGNPLNTFASVQDGFVVKLDSLSGAFLWNTFIGGSGTENIQGATLDLTGNLIAVGYGNSNWGMPITSYSGGGDDAFTFCMSATGELLWNTYLGGSANDSLISVIVDNSGNIYAAGHSDANWGTPLRAYTADRDVLVTKFTNTGNLLWHSFYGGTGYDLGRSIHVDNNGNIYFGGPSTVAWGNPTRSYTGNYDASVVKLDERAPQTTDNINNLWYKTDVTINLGCTDNLWGSDCATTYYTTDGSDPTTGSTQGNTLTLSNEGIYTIKYFSVDNAGNSEKIKTAVNTVRIDKTPPQKPTIKSIGKIANVPDKDSLTYYFTEQNPRIQGTAEANSTVKFVVGGNIYSAVTDSKGNYAIQLQNPILSRGNNTITYFVTDAADNNSTNRTLTLIIGEENFPAWLIPSEVPSVTLTNAHPIVPTPSQSAEPIGNNGENSYSKYTMIKIVDEKGKTIIGLIKIDGKQFTADEKGSIALMNFTPGVHEFEVVLGSHTIRQKFEITNDEVGKEKTLTIAAEKDVNWWLIIILLVLVSGGIAYRKSKNSR